MKDAEINKFKEEIIKSLQYYCQEPVLSKLKEKIDSTIFKVAWTPNDIDRISDPESYGFSDHHEALQYIFAARAVACFLAQVGEI